MKKVIESMDSKREELERRDGWNNVLKEKHLIPLWPDLIYTVPEIDESQCKFITWILANHPSWSRYHERDETEDTVSLIILSLCYSQPVLFSIKGSHAENRKEYVNDIDVEAEGSIHVIIRRELQMMVTSNHTLRVEY